MRDRSHIECVFVPKVAVEKLTRSRKTTLFSKVIQDEDNMRELSNGEVLIKYDKKRGSPLTTAGLTFKAFSYDDALTYIESVEGA